MPSMPVCALITLLLAPANSPARQASDSTILVELETTWNEAHLRGDAETLDRLWAEDLVVTVPGMAPMSRDEVLTFVRSGRMPFDRYQTSGLHVRVYGDTAIVTGRLDRERGFNGRTIADTWRFTKVYVRRSGRWRVVAFHASAWVS